MSLGVKPVRSFWSRQTLIKLIGFGLIGLTLGLLINAEIDIYFAGAAAALGIIILGLVGTITSSLFSLYLIYLYKKFYQSDAKPLVQYSPAALPAVTIQLPVYNEANVVERLLRSAAAVDYPHHLLQIQVIDDSTDETTEIIDTVIKDLSCQSPQIAWQHLRRPRREGWKAGALNYGFERASGEFIAIFDADFILPADFLQRTIHFFTNPNTGLVQARWAFLNRQNSTLTTTQASKLEAHQMFEQTARFWSGRWIHFHGTAGIWRKSAIESAGRWSSATDVEDADLSIRALLKGWKFIYLNDLQILSELPNSMKAYLTQQRRWKRGWIKIFQMYWWKVIRSEAPVWVRLDLLQRLANMFSTLMSLIVSMGALPAFILGQRLGVAWLVYGLYTLLMVTSLALRVYEGSTVASYGEQEADDPTDQSPGGFIRFLQGQIPYRLLLDMGTLWPWTLGTLEALAGKSKFERTPKTSQIDLRMKERSPLTMTAATQKSYGVHASLLELGVLFLAGFTLICIYFSIVTGHWLSIFFYFLQLLGLGWVAVAMVGERRF